MTQVEPMSAFQRRRIIVELLAGQEYVTTAEIRAATGASTSTANRDLAHLARTGALRRLHGGATRPDDRPRELTDLRWHITRLSTVVDTGDLDAVHALLTRALAACSRAQLRS